MTTQVYARRPSVVVMLLALALAYWEAFVETGKIQVGLVYHVSKRYVHKGALFLGLIWVDVNGNAQMRITAIILGVVVLMIGMIVAGILDQTAADAGAAEKPIGSFAGAKPLNDLIPTLIRVVLVMVGVGMIGIGTAGFARVGPLGR